VAKGCLAWVMAKGCLALAKGILTRRKRGVNANPTSILWYP